MITDYHWNFAPVFHHGGELADGIVGTLQLTVSAMAIAASLGLMLAIMRLSEHRYLSRAAALYVEVFRAAPALVLIVWFYYAFPIVVGISFDNYAAATIAIGLQASASWAETYRTGLLSVSRGQREAARAIGMSPGEIMRHVILPQALRRVLPLLFIRIIELLKVTALAAAIAYGELLYQAVDVSSQTYRPVETFTVVALLYLAVIFGLSQTVRLLERRLSVFQH